jgi:hypothetical protein
VWARKDERIITREWRFVFYLGPEPREPYPDAESRTDALQEVFLLNDWFGFVKEVFGVGASWRKCGLRNWSFLGGILYFMKLFAKQ